MPGIGTTVLPDVLRQISATTFNGTFQPIGSALLYPSPLVKLVNNTSVLVTISWDGVNTHDVLPSLTYSVYDFCTNAGTPPGLYIQKGTQFYASGVAGTGSVYLVVFQNTVNF